ncbi:hypothetical protein IW261DRAFT_909240 [Armillaria novae-zelandiae]|uniref:Uncharacterized protein n=1 Tax=Armillaria novae-zelandiae TaxID=153914 RepID=A0AA39UA37_9AGAR|nr:hypothetical protein IW261DRAFT_909240 [Armillaria novae-zelandiae]
MRKPCWMEVLALTATLRLGIDDPRGFQLSLNRRTGSFSIAAQCHPVLLSWNIRYGRNLCPFGSRKPHNLSGVPHPPQTQIYALGVCSPPLSSPSSPALVDQRTWREILQPPRAHAGHVARWRVVLSARWIVGYEKVGRTGQHRGVVRVAVEGPGVSCSVCALKGFPSEGQVWWDRKARDISMPFGAAPCCVQPFLAGEA